MPWQEARSLRGPGLVKECPGKGATWEVGRPKGKLGDPSSLSVLPSGLDGWQWLGCCGDGLCHHPLPLLAPAMLEGLTAEKVRGRCSERRQMLHGACWFEDPGLRSRRGMLLWCFFLDAAACLSWHWTEMPRLGGCQMTRGRQSNLDFKRTASDGLA